MQYDDQDQYYWDGSHEFRKAQSAKERCKVRRNTTIRKGIDDYFDHNKLRRNIVDSYEGIDDWDDFDDFDEEVIN
ncbi:hypothetical protein ACH42_12150 [Endozoicomonas sp. (ex Bugula neritina AB1)]|nr:hypothetical protein ACH42_12150 [Endozoicomonas sp. (ex Bugula neritina AB1)]